MPTTAARASFVGSGARWTDRDEDSSVQSARKLARKSDVRGYFRTEAGANTQNARIFGIVKVSRDTVEMIVSEVLNLSFDGEPPAATVNIPAFNINKTMAIVQASPDTRRGVTRVLCWG